MDVAAKILASLELSIIALCVAYVPSGKTNLLALVLVPEFDSFWGN